jgi:aminopeptidase YwaD
MTDALETRIAEWMHRLCDEYPDRHVGGVGNRAATDLFVQVAEECGFDVETAELDCVEWERGTSSLAVGDVLMDVHPGPYSLPCDVAAPLRVASTVERLEAGDHRGCVLLVTGDLVKEQLMPKDFTFFNPASHKRIVAAFEAAAPAAILAATGMNPQLSGGSYPFPLIEDGDFDIPNAYIKDVDGDLLLPLEGSSAVIRIDSRRLPARAAQTIARKRGAAEGRILFWAHVDSKDGTPGALDNGTGVAALLGLMELLAEREPAHDVEIVPLNGED